MQKYLLLKVKEAVLILVEIGEHVEAFSFAYVIDHVVLKELVDVICGNFSKLHSVNSFKGCPGFKSMLFCQLLPLLLHDFLIF